MDSLLIEIFSIDSKLLSGNVNSAIFPGSDGSFQILKNHAPIVSTLKKGEIIIDGEISLEDNTSKDLYDIKKDKKKISLNIESGLVEMKRNSIKVLIN
jgi:F-type H+-transporting ATPase subunit epsilon